MFDAKVAHASDFDDSLVNGIFDCFPAFKPGCFTSIGAVQKKEVDVSQSALLQRLSDRFSGVLVGNVGLQFGRIVDVFAGDAGVLA